jgi:outer membrane protein assembly factor BamB
MMGVSTMISRQLALSALLAFAAMATTRGDDALGPVVTTAPSEPYHFGMLRLTTSQKQTMQLYLQFRSDRAVASHILLDGNLYSPHSTGKDGTLMERCDAGALRFDGKALRGEFKWLAPSKQIETISLDATVNEGVVTGTAGDAALEGWLRSAEQMSRLNGFAAGKDWPCWTGPKNDWSGIDANRPLIADFSKYRLVWFSEATFGGGREMRTCPILGVSGSWTPIVGDGRIYFIHQRPSGTVLDEEALHKAEATLAKLLAEPSSALDAALRRAQQQGVRRIALVDADDVIVCLDAASGKVVWETVLTGRSFNPAPYNKHADQNRTGCYGEGKVFMLGRTFRLYACEGATGKLLWETALPKTHAVFAELKRQALAKKKQMAADSGGLRGAGYPPLYYAAGVVFCQGFAEGGIVGFDAASGKLLWTLPGNTPAVWNHQDKQYIVFMGPEGEPRLHCADPRDGQVIWRAPIEGDPRGKQRFLRLLGSYLITANLDSRKPPHFVTCYLLESAGPRKLWTLTDQEAALQANSGVASRAGIAYLRLRHVEGNSSKLLAVELASGKVLAQAATHGGSQQNAVVIANDDRLFVQPDGSHPSGHGTNLEVFALPELKLLGEFRQPHHTTGGYDVPMAIPYVDGRFIIRGRNRIFCYDVRAEAEAF